MSHIHSRRKQCEDCIYIKEEKERSSTDVIKELQVEFEHKDRQIRELEKEVANLQAIIKEYLG
jgi:SMC interacting uncharacterized protein involved in chromosome segregation